MKNNIKILCIAILLFLSACGNDRLVPVLTFPKAPVELMKEPQTLKLIVKETNTINKK